MTDSKTDGKVKMEYRHLGRTGLKVSALSFGAWVTWGNSVSDDDAYKCFLAAFDEGCNFFDNAEVYSAGKAEVTMGKCIKLLYSERKVERSQLVICTKVFWGGADVNQRGLSRKHVIEGVTASLNRLQLDYVDVIMAHRPDPETPMEETVRAFNWLIDKGKAFYWGTSEWSADQIMEANSVAQKLNLIGPAAEQPQYSMLHRTRFELEYGRLYKEVGLGTTIWSPLACGLLTGKYNSKNFAEGTRLGGNDSYKWLREQLLKGEGLNGLEERNFDVIIAKVDKLMPIAKKIGCSMAQLAIAWVLKNPNVSTCITGASSETQVKENFKALQYVSALTPELMTELETVLANKPRPVKNYR
jgi:voltage-dependent potassium channel beta subunit